MPCPISEQVLKAIELVDTPEDATKPIVNYHNADLISPILQNLPTSFKSHDSIGEAYFWITRATAVLSIIALLIFLFHHD